MFLMGAATALYSIDRQPVTSTSIASIGYDARTRMLDVEFRSGAIYRYLQVPNAVASGFKNAPSKGGYFVRHIRGKFAFRQIRR